MLLSLHLILIEPFFFYVALLSFNNLIKFFLFSNNEYLNDVLDLLIIF